MQAPPQAPLSESFWPPSHFAKNKPWRRKDAGSGDGSRFFLELQLDLLVLADIDGYPAAVLETPEQQLVCHRSPERVLEMARHGLRAAQRLGDTRRQVLVQ